MENKSYIPVPVDTSGVELPQQLAELTEKMARNVHEVWAAERIAEGWTYGPQRNDSLKQHPSLIPYAELSDSERDYDRHTAVETLKLILMLGYRIEK